MIPARAWRVAGVILATASLAYFLYQPWRGYHQTSPFFITFIAGALTLRSGSTCLYCPDRIASAAANYLHVPVASVNSFPYNYPPPIAVLFEPLSQFQPRTAFAIFTALSLTAVAVAGWMLYRYVLPERWAAIDRIILATLAMTTVGSGLGVRDGALDPALFLALVAAVLARRHGKRVLAGLLLSVVLAKPQLIWLVPPALLFGREWRMLAGMASGGLVWLSASVLFVSPSALFDWVTTGTANSSSEFSLGLPGVAGRMTGSPHYWLGLVAICGATMLALFWYLRRGLGEHPDIMLALAVAASLAISPHLWEYDMLMAAFSLCVWARSSPAPAIVTTVFMSALFVVNRAQGWEDDLVWIPEAVIAAGLAVELKAHAGARRRGHQP